MTAGPDDRRGEIGTEPDGRRRLVFRRSWRAPAADVWSALTEPERSVRWVGRYDGEHGAGGEGSFTMTAEEGAPASRLRIVECEPPRRLVVQWLDEMGWRVALDLTEDGGTTTLVFTHVLDGDIGTADVASGWHWYLDRLDAEISGTEPPRDWDSFVAEVGPRYGYAPA